MSWPILGVSVRSQQDLDTMRKQLGDAVEYFERDLRITVSHPEGVSGGRRALRQYMGC